MNTPDKNTNKTNNFLNELFTDRKTWRDVLMLSVANAAGLGMLMLVLWGMQRCAHNAQQYDNIRSIRTERTR